ncbi:TraR/DksA family transcriptional regulator [Rhizobium laguerreae]|uniref:TraR/DksA C4-type zinc finger protein n=1 Tax=Rhizobium laguerreae TaxID=1076926 RepID=UPI001C92036F|nr:TraR/DksA C4-type zinc finger protein [Rhizobium laguerreae]MBY3151029.1 TraR/DksA family transcriptional regulator [Rhizobium laguerreae]MBY3433219.1 TraR/DksA family transcriptional regulator [Rhizobium laguerreae]
MADEVDRANDISEDHRTVSIRSISREVDRKSGLTHCDECGGEIPLARRLAYPSAILCVNCKEQDERDARIYRR